MKKLNSQGFSLIETMIAIAIMGIVATIAARFMRSSKEGQVQMNARLDTLNRNSTLIQLVERDLNFRQSNSSYAITANGIRLSITRRQAVDLSDLNSSDQIYAVEFISECVSRPARLASYQGLRTQLSDPRLQNAGRCLKLLNCDDSQIPRVRISMGATGRIPSYPSQLFPELNLTGTLGDRVLGQALCVTAVADQIRISVDGIHAFGQDLYKVVSQDKSLSITASDYQILPHEL